MDEFLFFQLRQIYYFRHVLKSKSIAHLSASYEIFSSHMNRPLLTGIIMAGGKSSRMGKDKGSILFNHQYLVQYAIDALTPPCSELLISTNNEWYDQFGYPLVKDIIKDCGPLGGIYSSLLTAKTPYIIVLACDMPFVDAPILEKLIDNIQDFDCVVPNIGHQYEPLCAVYSKSMIPAIEQHIKSGNYALNGLIRESNHCFVDFTNEAKAFMNLNTMSDLDKGIRLL